MTSLATKRKWRCCVINLECVKRSVSPALRECIAVANNVDEWRPASLSVSQHPKKSVPRDFTVRVKVEEARFADFTWNLVNKGYDTLIKQPFAQRTTSGESLGKVPRDVRTNACFENCGKWLVIQLLKYIRLSSKGVCTFIQAQQRCYFVTLIKRYGSNYGNLGATQT